MNYLAYLVAVAVPALVFFLLGCARARATAEGSPIERPAGGDVEDRKDQRAELERRLEALAAAEPPSDAVPVAAMCYETAAPPERIDYVCPSCGAKTLYNRDRSEIIADELPACRREVAASHGLRVSLDESQF
jgi:hypothetical protein